MARLTIRIDLSPRYAIGPGKIRLLELIDELGSISGAGRAMKMSYRRAWLLVDELNHIFAERVATTTLGGAAGGGAALTVFGRGLVESYRRMEAETYVTLSKQLEALDAALGRRPRRGAQRTQSAAGRVIRGAA